LDEWGNFLNNTDSNSSFHISNSKSTKRWELREWFNAHRFGGFQVDDSTVRGLNEFWFFFQDFTISSINLFFNLVKFTGNVSSVTIKNWSITISNFTWMTKNNNLSIERITFFSSINFIIRSNITSFKFFNSKTFDIETNIVSWNSLSKLNMMHFNRFNFSNFIGWSEINIHSWFKDTSLNSSNWNCSDTRDLIDILEWKSEWFLHRSFWGFEFIKSLVKSLTFVPFHVVRFLNHVITVPS